MRTASVTADMDADLALDTADTNWPRLGLVWALRLLVVIVPLALWEWTVEQGMVKQFLFSRPTLIWGQLVTWIGDGTIVRNVGFTLRNTLVGYVVGALLGIGLAVLFAVLPRVGHVFTPFMTTLNAIPRFAFAPLLVSVLGFGILANISLVVLVVLFVSFFSVYSGLQAVDRDHLRWVRSLGASKWEEWRSVRFPALIRWVVASLRVTIGLAVSAAIVGEFIGAGKGIGYIVAFSVNLFRTTGVYAGLAVVLVMAAVIDAALRWAERRWAHWVGQG